MKVLFIVIDTLRANHLSCYGYHRKTTPNIDVFASKGVLFSNAYASDVPTQPSYTSMFTGQRGVKTGIVSHFFGTEEELRDSTPYLSEILAKNGYATAAVSTLYIMRKWFTRGFQYYMNPMSWANPGRMQQVDADEINAYAIPWIKENYKKDFFMFVQYWDPHTLYIPPKKYRYLWYKGDPTDPSNHSLDEAKKQEVWPFQYKLIKAMRDAENLPRDITDIEYIIAQYDGEISYVDEKVGELLHVLEDLDIADDTLVILTADHGENLGGNHAYFDHVNVYEPVIHVPLIVKYPNIIPRRKRIEALVQLIDIPYLILETLGIPIPDEFQGKSLLSLIDGKNSEIYSEVYSNQGSWSCKRAIITKDGWKLIKTIDQGFWESPPIELFNLKKDSEENHNLVKEEEDIVNHLELQMNRWLESNLGGRPDPLRLASSRGLPPKTWVKNAAKMFTEENQATYEEWRKNMGY